MPNRSFNFDGIFPAWVQRIINVYQRFGPMLRWVLKYTGILMLGYLLHAGLCSIHIIKPSRKGG